MFTQDGVQVQLLPVTIALLVVMLPTVPVVTVAVEGAFTVKLAVAVVLVSSRVSVAAAEPQVKSAVADVLELTVGVPIDDPVPPLTLKSPVGDSDDQIVFAPVKVTVPWHPVEQPLLPAVPEFGETDSVAVATVMLVLMESVVSVIVETPVPELVVIVTV